MSTQKTANPGGLIIDRTLVDKYTMRGPRYTSYPTAPEWTERVGEPEYWQHIDDTNQKHVAANPLSIYIHIPFCDVRCSFCACNVIITRHDDVADEYVDLVSHEVNMVAPKINPNRKVNQFHLGGGTPTHLKPASLDRLLGNFKRHFSFEPEAELSCEVDLRVTNDEHLEVLLKHGFNRISTGVQDFSLETQEAIRRVQSAEQTIEFCHKCRNMGFKSINIDLIYGLPHQSVETFGKTIDAVFEVDPDRIALYNYAHLPSKVPHQRKIEESWLPSNEERFSIFKLAVDRLSEDRYYYIGMDHFAKENDELTVAQREGTLQRNFMGFTTRAGSDLYAFGTSSISSLPALYIQNVKKLKPYRDMIREDRLPIERGFELSLDDRMRRWTIMELMCNLVIPINRFERLWGVKFHEYFHDELLRLQPFVEDKLIEPNMKNEIRVTDLGQIIVRPIAMVFDAYLNKVRKAGEKSPVFSRTL